MLALRDGEQVRAQAKIHWSTYVRPSFTAVISVVLVALAFYAYLVNNRDSNLEVGAVFVPFAIAGCLPLLGRWLQNRTRSFIVTSQRIYLEEGVISRNSTEIPLSKINDVSLHQSLFQRVVGAGDIVVLTGNDLKTSFPWVAHPEQVREAISQGR